MDRPLDEVISDRQVFEALGQWLSEAIWRLTGFQCRDEVIVVEEVAVLINTHARTLERYLSSLTLRPAKDTRWEVADTLFV